MAWGKYIRRLVPDAQRPDGPRGPNGAICAGEDAMSGDPNAYQSPDSSWLRDPVQLRPAAPPAAPSRPFYPPAPYPFGPSIPLREPDPGAGMAIAALIFGIVTVFLSFAGACDFPFGVLGATFGVLGLRSTRRAHLARAGIALSGVGLALALGATVLFLYLIGAFR